MAVLSVSELNQKMRAAISKAPFLSQLTIQGEISNFRPSSSGHWFFTLKDQEKGNASSVSCVLYKGSQRQIQVQPRDGLQVELVAKGDFYTTTGEFKLVVSQMKESGEGALYAAFEALKVKLAAEGLFAPERKRKLPYLPKRIGVLTSATGDVIRDILNVLNRRFPNFNLLLIPCQVQGEKAPASLIRGLELANRRADLEVLIIARGGGSFEDLNAFNDEGLARAIVASHIPVISAVGHETDYTICDFVSDLRAPTPSAAAELVLPEYERLQLSLSSIRAELKRRLEGMLRWNRERLKHYAKSPYFKDPSFLLRDRAHSLDRLQDRLLPGLKQVRDLRHTHLQSLRQTLNNEMSQQLARQKERQMRAVTLLEALSPLKVLSRGYTMVKKADSVVGRLGDLKLGDLVQLQFNEGEASARIEKIRSRENGQEDQEFEL